MKALQTKVVACGEGELQELRGERHYHGALNSGYDFRRNATGMRKSCSRG
jgi:hypothetical protein